ncbi:metallophosphoesterase domain-containing protein 1 [Tritrichomonas musculus]|uniref:Metallophosphoesterase domain-containing protein 1 n=1 Tax=Tritrichomonas musculus TaxID=1915356 RepID=A0ABR2GQC9_9EUKA
MTCYKYKVLIAGNHEVTFDIENRRDIIGHYLKREEKDYLNLVNEYQKQTREKVMPEEFKLYNDNAVNFIKKQITEDNDLIYLEESSIAIEGLNIYGTPYSPFFYNWAFPTFLDHEREKGGITASRWNKIPENTDIVLVHGLLMSILDVHFLPKKSLKLSLCYVYLVTFMKHTAVNKLKISFMSMFLLLISTIMFKISLCYLT